jgi:hypothetical protein
MRKFDAVRALRGEKPGGRDANAAPLLGVTASKTNGQISADAALLPVFSAA